MTVITSNSELEYHFFNDYKQLCIITSTDEKKEKIFIYDQKW